MKADKADKGQGEQENENEQQYDDTNKKGPAPRLARGRPTYKEKARQ